jgi:glutaconate CoA-transferase subunit A
MAEFVSLSEAVTLIADNTTLALGGMTLYRRPVAYVRELLRHSRRARDLTLLSFTCSYESDLLVGAGCISKVRTVYFGLESFGLAPMFTEKANRGDIEIIEETETSIVLGLRAHISGVGYLPSPAWIGTDLPVLRPDVKTVIDPYNGDTLAAFPAIPVDALVLHALEADRSGNIKINHNLGIDLELVFAAKTVIATAERLVERVERSTDGVVIPAPGAHYIAIAPNGAQPTSCYPLYPMRGGELLRYVEACNGGKFNTYLNQFLEAGSTEAR